MPLMFTAFLLISIVDKRDVLMCNIVLNTIVFITVYFEHDLIDSPYRSLDFVVLLGFGLTMGAILALLFVRCSHQNFLLCAQFYTRHNKRRTYVSGVFAVAWL